MDKCYLVVLEGQFGRAYQIWYEDRGKFIGCAGQEPIEKLELPDPSTYGMERWSIVEAIQYARSIQ